MLKKLFQKLDDWYINSMIRSALDIVSHEFENTQREIEYLKEKVGKLEKDVELLKKRVNMNSIFGSN